MRRLILILVSITAMAAEDAPPGHGPHIDVVVPIDPYEHERLYWPDGKAHHRAPGAVTIDKPGYVCDLDRKTFINRNDFVAHLRRAHRIRQEDLPESLVTVGGQVHYPPN